MSQAEFTQPIEQMPDRRIYLAGNGIGPLAAGTELTAVAVPNYSVRLVDGSDPAKIEKILEFERRMWELNGFGPTDKYRKYLGQSRFISAFDDSGECIGVSHLMDGNPELPPFLAADEIQILDPQLEALLRQGCESGLVEELGITAVAPEAPQVTLNMELWRAAWRDADSRGIKAWGIVMEPRRVKAMRRRYGFPFEQIGPETEDKYEGDYCAAHVMWFDEVHTKMKANRPQYYHYFVEAPLAS